MSVHKITFPDGWHLSILDTSVAWNVSAFDPKGMMMLSQAFFVEPSKEQLMELANRARLRSIEVAYHRGEVRPQ